MRRTYVVVDRYADELLRAGTNACLDIRPRAFALGGQVSAERSSCPGYRERRARDSIAPLRRSSAGWMPVRIGRLSTGVGRRQSVTKSQGVVDGGVDKVAPVGVLLLLHPNWNRQAASRVRRVMSASCEVTRGVNDT